MTDPSGRAGERFGKYRLTTLLGRGGMGEVYEAYDTEKDRTVALKILRAEYAQDERFRARFLRESHAAASLQEPHVIPIHDWGEIDGNLYIDMRLVQGQTLHDLISVAPLEPERAIAIVAQVAAALDAAHALGLVHRDVKPQNVIVTPADFAYLVDFGIAETVGDTRLTMAGTHIGSLAYMAPERFEDTPAGPATDTYALACVLYEALTGTTPFGGGSQQSQIAAHLTAPPPRPSLANSRLAPALDDVITRGMAKEPDDRYGSATALGRAAARALHAPTVPTTPAPITQIAPVPTGPTQTATAHAPQQPAPSFPGHYRQPGPQYPGYSAPPSAPVTGPTVGPSGSRNWLLPVAVLGLALLLGAVGVIIGLLMSGNSSKQADSGTQPTTRTYLTNSTVAQTADSDSSRTTTTTTATDPNVSSLAQLRQLADGDRSFVAGQLTDVWVPQLSSKRPGVVDDGITWDDTSTLAEHLRLRDRYGARLLWSGDWSTFDAADFWVTVVPVTFGTAQGALSWCTSNGFDADHCYAKLISTTHPASGSTAHN